MASEAKRTFLDELARRYGTLRKLDRSQSLYDVGGDKARIYVRYSKIHGRGQAFYGLREEDLRKLEAHRSIICFLWDGQTEPLLVPFSDYESVFQSLSRAGDGQYKVQVYLRDEGTKLYIAKAGQFNAERYFGWDGLEALVGSASSEPVPDFSHAQIQTLLGAIGATKNYDVWVPPSDREGLDWSISDRFECRSTLPYGFEPAEGILREVDVIWVQKGSTMLRALFEVEHSTPMYSGLLRLNDIYLLMPPSRQPTFSIVANDARRELFVRQLSRPTFRTSGLSNLCSFLEYQDVFGWHKRLTAR